MNRNLLTASLLSTALMFGATGIVLADDYKTEKKDHTAMSETDSAQPGTDTWITTKVKADLLATDNVEGTKINVTTVNGVVTLAGMLDTQDQVNRAIQVARGIEGVTDVNTVALKSR